mgnify:CR=1 FL=1
MSNGIPTLNNAVAGPGKDSMGDQNQALEEVMPTRIKQVISEEIAILQKQFPRQEKKIRLIGEYLTSQAYNSTKNIFTNNS